MGAIGCPYLPLILEDGDDMGYMEGVNRVMNPIDVLDAAKANSQAPFMSPFIEKELDTTPLSLVQLVQLIDDRLAELEKRIEVYNQGAAFRI